MREGTLPASARLRVSGAITIRFFRRSGPISYGVKRSTAGSDRASMERLLEEILMAKGKRLRWPAIDEIDCARSAAPAWKLLAGSVVGRRHVEVDGPERRTAGVADLVPVALLDEEQRAGCQREPPPVHERLALAVHHVEPLVGAAMAIVRPALALSGSDDHGGRLRARVAERHAGSGPEAQGLALHARGSAPGERSSARRLGSIFRQAMCVLHPGERACRPAPAGACASLRRESSRLVVEDRAPDLALRVHHERAVLRDRLAQGL